MPNGRPDDRSLTPAERAFNTATITVGGLYLATHSVTVTLVGAGAGCVITCWALWLAQRREVTPAGQKSLSPNNESDQRSTLDTGLPTPDIHRLSAN